MHSNLYCKCYPYSKDDFKLKIESILSKLEIDIEVFVAAGSSIFQKPLPGTFHLLKEYLGMRSENILMVGDAAGRIAKKPHRPKVRLFIIVYL